MSRFLEIPPARSWLLAGLLALGAGHVTSPAQAVTHLKRGDTPPPLEVPDLDGEVRRLAELRGRVVLLVFGELYHRRTQEACAAIRSVLDGDRLSGAPITTLIVVSENTSAATLRARAADLGSGITVLHDAQRRAFGTYRVAVMPSAVVIDKDGKVIHAMAGYNVRFADVVTDALLVGIGALSPERFQETLLSAAAAVSDERLARAGRLTSLAQQLEQRGLDQLAEDKFREALEIAPEHAPARLGVGMLMLKRGRLALAEERFREVLDTHPDSTEAAIGLAHVQVRRGGEEIAEAERICHEVLARHPAEPAAHYLLGLVHEQRNEPAEAAASYRKAAELLMGRGRPPSIAAGGQEP